MSLNTEALAVEIRRAREEGRQLPGPLSTREPGFDLDAGYAVEAHLRRQRLAAGHATVGRKAGYANKAVWRALKLETLVWGHMYDDTVVYADADQARLSVGRLCAPKIEPEIVFKLRRPVDVGTQDAATVLGAVEWLALGFEVVESLFPGWSFQPADFVAAYGCHAALVVGTPRPVEPASIPSLADALPRFRVRLQRSGTVTAEGSGRNVLRSPALCLGELARAVEARAGEAPLATGDLVSTGSLTEPQPIAPGQTWTAHADELDLPDLTLHTTA